jgi:MFS family permease
LVRSRAFNIFWAGQTLSGLGDAFAFVALPLLVLSATGSLVQMGLVTGTFGVASLVAGLFSGLIVDRADRRRLMIVCDLVRFLVYLAIPLTWWLRGPQIAVIYVVTAVGALFGNTFQVAAITAVANLVDKEELTEANGRLQGSYALMFLIGPMVAGTVCQRFGPATAIGIDAVTFFASGISLRFLQLRRSSADRSSDAGESWLSSLLAGARFLWTEPSLRWVTILLGGFAFIASAFLDLFIFHLKTDLHQSDAMVGMVFGVSSMGSIFGALAAGRLRKRFGFAATWLSAGFLQGIAVAAMGFTGTVFGIAALGSVFAFAMLVRSVNSIAMRQEVTPDHLLGRVTSAFWAIITAPAPIGAAAATAIAARTGVGPVFVGMGLLTLVLSTIGVFSPLGAK